jgi:hypothetical protein
MTPVAPPPQVGDSPRVRLAQIALDAALSVAGVQGTDAGPHGLCATSDAVAGTLTGVAVIAQADGRYSVELCLVAGIVPLLELADEVRRRVRARAQREGVAEFLGELNVEFTRVMSAAEIAEEAAAREREAQLAAQAEVAAHGEAAAAHGEAAAAHAEAAAAHAEAAAVANVEAPASAPPARMADPEPLPPAAADPEALPAPEEPRP